jgi:hypothetical protein
MRRLALLVAAGSFLVSSVTAGAGGLPSATVGLDQFAFASWTTTEHGIKVIYFAAGFNRAPADRMSVGFVGRAECTERDHHGHTRLICRGRARPTQLEAGDFLVDPALSGAQLTVERDGMTHSVTWTGRGQQPEPFWHQHAGTDVGVLVMASMSRRADPSAFIYERQLEPGRPGFIFEGAFAEAYIYSNDVLDFGDVELRNGVLYFSKVLR